MFWGKFTARGPSLQCAPATVPCGRVGKGNRSCHNGYRGKKGCVLKPLAPLFEKSPDGDPRCAPSFPPMAFAPLFALHDIQAWVGLRASSLKSRANQNIECNADLGTKYKSVRWLGTRRMGGSLVAKAPPRTMHSKTPPRGIICETTALNDTMENRALGPSGHPQHDLQPNRLALQSRKTCSVKGGILPPPGTLARVSLRNAGDAELGRY